MASVTAAEGTLKGEGEGRGADRREHGGAGVRVDPQVVG